MHNERIFYQFYYFFLHLVPCQPKQLNKLVRGALRLVDGTSPCNGRLEIYNNERWGTICNERINVMAVTVACRELLGTFE